MLRVVGKELELGMTISRHNGIPSGAQRDADVRDKIGGDAQSVPKTN